MKRYFIALLAILFYAVAMADEPAARLEIDDNNVDFGALEVDAEVQHAEVTIRNAGNAPLEILRVFGDCSCTTGEYDGGVLAPGASAKVKVNFDPTGRKPGEFVKTVKIRSNASNPIARIYLRGHIKRPLSRRE